MPYISHNSSENPKVFKIKGYPDSAVCVRTSVAGNHTLSCNVPKKPGDHPFGKHARRNMGVSIVREDRELVLIQQIDAAGSRENQFRWCGVEISFDKGLDDVMEVDQTKQKAAAMERALSDFARRNDSGNSDIFDEHDDPLMEIAEFVHRRVNMVFRDAKKRLEKILREAHHQIAEEINSPESRAENIIYEDAVRTGGEILEISEPAVRERTIKSVAQRIEEENLPVNEAKSIATRIVEDRLPVSFGFKEMNDSSFFNFEELDNGHVRILLNRKHSMEKYLEFISNESASSGNHSVHYIAILLILYGYIKHERETEDGKHREHIRETREDWSRNIKDVIEELNAGLPDPVE